MEIREFSRNDRVKVNNVYGWDISFYSDVARRDITIPAFATGYSLLTVDQTEEELLKQNIFLSALMDWAIMPGYRYAILTCTSTFSALRIKPTI